MRLAVVVLLALAAPLHAQAARPIFRFETNEMWLNMHHYLHVLGRQAAAAPDATREAVRGAPGDQQRGLAALTPQERQEWQAAIEFYKTGPSTRDLTFNRELAAATSALANADDAPTLVGVAIDPALTHVLEAAAPVYRKGWWTLHRAANERWLAAMRPLLDRHGAQVLAFITNAYGLQWPENGYPIHLSGFSNWAGAYSTYGDLLVVSSIADANRDASGLEILFHEAMHQWDSDVFVQLRTHARAIDMRVPGALTHVMIFWTAGEAVKRAVLGHVPYAIKNGLYERNWGVLRDAVRDHWQPWLDGRISRDSAHAALIKRTATERRSGTTP